MASCRSRPGQAASRCSSRQRPGSAVHVPGDGGPGDPSPLGGTIDHRGGILFINLKNGKKIEVSRFTIDLTHADLTGIVNGNPKARVPLSPLTVACQARGRQAHRHRQGNRP